MGKFDTHGGYFAPQDYFRVNTGGSHEENPNGGVQIGVDQNGTPNLLEEGEPVYRDFVFSDNIKANKSILKEFVIPDKYAGMLYSEIADKFIEEAEERPMDNISRNGLEAMLGRLAEAQEEQKLRKEESDLKAELSKLPPEELAMLAQNLGQANAEETPVMQPQMMPQEMYQEQMAMAPQQQVYPQQNIPIMAKGGNIFRNGSGRGINWERIGLIGEGLIGGAATGAALGAPVAGVGAMPGAILGGISGAFLGNDLYNRDIAGALIDIIPGMSVEKVLAKSAGKAGAKLVSKAATKAAATKLGSKVPGIGKLAGAGTEAAGTVVIPGRKAGMAAKDVAGLMLDPSYLWRNVHPTSTAGKAAKLAGSTLHSLATADNDVQLFTGISPLGTVIDGINGSRVVEATPEQESELFGLPFAKGGKVNRFGDGSPYMWDPKGLLWGNESESQTPTQAVYIPYDNSNGFMYFNTDTGDYDKGYRDWVEGIKFLDNGVFDELSKYYKGKTGRNLTKSNAIKLGLDKKFGKFHDIMGQAYTNYLNSRRASDVLPSLESNALRAGAGVQSSYSPKTGVQLPKLNGLPQESITAVSGNLRGVSRNLANPDVELNPDTQSVVDGSLNRVTAGKQGPKVLSTLPRYAGIAQNLLSAAYNLSQKPDEYVYQPLNSYFPEGRMPLQMVNYNPMDMSIPMQTVRAQGQSTARSILNSGAGPVAGQMLLANGFNTANALGNTFLQGWQANRQLENSVIGANNQARAQMSNFDATLSARRAELANQIALNNQRMALQIAMLNNQAEQAKASAVGTGLDNAAKGLAGIGNENFVMNQINDNPYLLRYIKPDGTSVYSGKCGGLLRKYKK